ncbi:SurA N-terminal domain-containing protein [Lichenihabitans psoromatis]|uniref:SurA N-terminal domain-containing protein n=1 Tax=Lichenihabitans psoromatis TaxID=2528642 RepID=UPI0013F16FE0|nr:SurA N-terminal domain-containing protein [Lichenihabitans psoromatis]
MSRSVPTIGTLAVAAVALGWCWIGSAAPASAQAIAAIVNGDPITTSDVDEQMKFLRIIKKPASRADALEDLVADRIKLREANKYGIDASDSDLSQTLNRVASAAKMQPQALANSLQAAKGNTDIIRQHLRAVAAWNNYVRNRNKALNVSEEEITAALAKSTSAGKESADYTLQQVVFVVPSGASAGVLEGRMREAQALRSRFQDCASGLPLARSLPDVGIKPAVTRNASALSAKTRETLDQTPKGRLTAPERSASGIEMIAVCGRDDEADRTTVRDNIQADLITERLSKIADRMYQDLRKTAVVEKH